MFWINRYTIMGVVSFSGSLALLSKIGKLPDRETAGVAAPVEGLSPLSESFKVSRAERRCKSASSPTPLTETRYNSPGFTIGSSVVPYAIS